VSIGETETIVPLRCHPERGRMPESKDRYGLICDRRPHLSDSLLFGGDSDQAPNDLADNDKCSGS